MKKLCAIAFLLALTPAAANAASSDEFGARFTGISPAAFEDPVMTNVADTDLDAAATLQAIEPAAGDDSRVLDLGISSDIGGRPQPDTRSDSGIEHTIY